MPYALINPQDGENIRSIPSKSVQPEYVAQPGEVVISDALYSQEGTWDAAMSNLRATTDDDRLRWAKKLRIRELEFALNDWYMTDVLSVQGDITVYKRAVGSVLSAKESAIFNTVSTNYGKLNAAITSINNATTLDAMNAVQTPVWDRVTV